MVLLLLLLARAPAAWGEAHEHPGSKDPLLCAADIYAEHESTTSGFHELDQNLLHIIRGRPGKVPIDALAATWERLFVSTPVRLGLITFTFPGVITSTAPKFASTSRAHMGTIPVPPISLRRTCRGDE